MVKFLTNFYLENKKNNYNFFFDLSKKDILNKSTVDEIHIKKKETVQFPTCDNLYFIKSGSLKKSAIDGSGNIKTIRILTKNNILLYSDLVIENSSLYFLQTLSDTVIYSIPLIKLAQEKSYNSEFLPLYYQLNSKIYFFKWFHSSNNGEKRVYLAILEILFSLATEAIEEDTTENFILPMYVTHEIISEISGVSRSYVTRIIEKLKEKKVVTYKNNSIVIRNLSYFYNQLAE